MCPPAPAGQDGGKRRGGLSGEHQGMRVGGRGQQIAFLRLKIHSMQLL